MLCSRILVRIDRFTGDAFAVLDRDGNGVLSADEFADGLQMLGIEMPKVTNVAKPSCLWLNVSLKCRLLEKLLQLKRIAEWQRTDKVSVHSANVLCHRSCIHTAVVSLCLSLSLSLSVSVSVSA